MAHWQRKARFAIALAFLAFAIAVALAFQRREAVPLAPLTRTDPNAVAETAGGLTFRVNRDKEEVRIAYDELRAYPDGSMIMSGVKVATERGGGRTFTVTAKQAQVTQNESNYLLEGDVRLTTSDGLTLRTEHATYTEQEGVLRAPGPVEFSRGRMNGSGVGLTYDKNRDVMAILDQIVVRTMRSAGVGDAMTISSGSLEFDRVQHIIRFEQSLTASSGGESIEADSGVARLTANEEQLETLELRGRARVTVRPGGAGGLREMTGRDIDLKYGADGETLEHALITGGAVIRVASESGLATRQITGDVIDVTLGPDGSSPTALTARGSVELILPEEQTTPMRTIRADALDGVGEPGRGLTSACFRGRVRFREKGAAVDRTAVSEALLVTLKPGLSSIDEATFTGDARFVDGKIVASAARARYAVEQGTLELAGIEPGGLGPNVRNDEISIDGGQIHVTLEGPQVKASDGVKSVLLFSRAKDETEVSGPAADGRPADRRKVPSMFKQDQPVIATADGLLYDGRAATAIYRGSAQLWQGATTIKAATIALDARTGDLMASGGPVATTTVLQQEARDGKKERSVANAKGNEFEYQEALRRATYLGDAFVIGPQGELRASKIELYLKPSGDELERAEAYDSVTLSEQGRKTIGNRLTYFGQDEKYVVTGTPLTIVDECRGETIGRTLTFFKAADRIVIDGSEQMRTRTQGAAKCR